MVVVVVERSGSIEDSKSSLDRFLGFLLLLDDEDDEELGEETTGSNPDETRKSKMS